MFHKGGQTIAEAFSPNLMTYSNTVPVPSTIASQNMKPSSAPQNVTVSKTKHPLNDVEKADQRKNGLKYLATLTKWFHDQTRDIKDMDDYEGYVVDFNVNVHNILKNKSSSPLVMDARPYVHEDPFCEWFIENRKRIDPIINPL